MSATEARAPRLPLRDSAPESPRIEQVMEQERERLGRPRYLTQVVATSPATWRATVNALHLYATLRKLDRPLVDAVCLYTSLLNGCRYCIDDAAGEALGNGWTADELLGLEAPDRAGFPAATAAALAYARAVTLDPAGIDAELEELRRHFDDEAVLELTTVVALKSFWNRFATALAVPPEGKCGDSELLSSLHGISDALRAARA